MIDWSKKAGKVNEVIENITKLSTDFMEKLEKVQEQVSHFEQLRYADKEEKIDSRVFPALNNLKRNLQSFDSTASSASMMFLMVQNDLTQLSERFADIDKIKKEFSSLNSGGEISKSQGDQMRTMDGQLKSIDRNINSLETDLKSKEKMALDLTKTLFSYVQAYLKGLSNLREIDSKVAKVIGFGDVEKHTDKLSKALSSYSSV